MDVLAESVEGTLKNLQGKRDFLAEQREHYIDIRSRLVSFNSGGDDEDDEEAKSQGMVFGDIIISASRIYLSIGYEYYVEKTKEEAIEFVDDKLKLMDSAVEQFDMKIQEALTTLENLNGLDNQVSNEQGEAENEEDFLPSIEIREELDEEGNVISSSVTPTTKQSSKSDIKEEGKAPTPQKERPTNEKRLSSFEENLKGKLSKEATQKKVVHPSKVDTENVYTFADLVQQMDQQDELDDGSIGADDINYDYDAFENSNFEVNDYYEDDEDDEDDGYLNHSIIPGFEAQSSFLSQIQQLRAQNQPQEHEQKRTKGNKPLKPILKKSSADEEPTKKEKPKRVGFASSLEIHEVENLKDETKRQTHSFKIPMYDIINNQEIMGPANEMVSDEFDGDLLAKMLGVQEADEVHDRYKDDVGDQEKLEQETSRSNKKNRMSRFKKDRAPKKPETLLNRGPVEGEPAVSDIVERRPVVNDVIEKEPVVSDITEREPTAGTSSKSDSALKKKDLKSLQKPRSSRFKKKKFDPKIFNDISDDEPEVKPEPNPKRVADVQEKFPSKIQEASRSVAQAGATAEDKPVRIANIDYHALGGDMDDMVKAYSLGIYDDDLDEDPGTVVEKLEDFKEYNRQVELLRDEIRDFQLENPPVATEEDEEHDSKIMVDVVEREVPESYADDEDEVALHPDRLHEAVAIEYRRLKETAASKWQSSPTQAEGELEPIDEFGNPVKTSRFRSQRLRMGE
ncbi:hypothetical protein SUVZ_06G0300 [Saccharomyces uvarum]|uniref:DUF3835 domain-containing protein n=1 Tax=Saccharomyces uvarum TaxID=230603 RepID=A0ABN8WTM4_SACUV|nr:hypothetical protein SUVZ_06G0300 [Saccharomyces uvarum]